MTPLFKKLQFKSSPTCWILRAPESFEPELAAMAAFADFVFDEKDAREHAFQLAFIQKQAKIDELAPKMAAQLPSDGLLWIAYPKGTSKKFKCDFNRDTGWAILGSLGFEPVRMIAIDEDWSALRFRRVEHIKTMTRSFAMSEGGKMKTSK